MFISKSDEPGCKRGIQSHIVNCEQAPDRQQLIGANNTAQLNPSKKKKKKRETEV